LVAVTFRHPESGQIEIIHHRHLSAGFRTVRFGLSSTPDQVIGSGCRKAAEL
jgi:hypothetical protein